MCKYNEGREYEEGRKKEGWAGQGSLAAGGLTWRMLIQTTGAALSAPHSFSRAAVKPARVGWPQPYTWEEGVIGGVTGIVIIILILIIILITSK